MILKIHKEDFLNCSSEEGEYLLMNMVGMEFVPENLLENKWQKVLNHMNLNHPQLIRFLVSKAIDPSSLLKELNGEPRP